MSDSDKIISLLRPVDLNRIQTQLIKWASECCPLLSPWLFVVTILHATGQPGHHLSHESLVAPQLWRFSKAPASWSNCFPVSPSTHSVCPSELGPGSPVLLTLKWVQVQATLMHIIYLFVLHSWKVRRRDLECRLRRSPGLVRPISLISELQGWTAVMFFFKQV